MTRSMIWGYCCIPISCSFFLGITGCMEWPGFYLAFGGEALRPTPRARRFCKEYTERCNRPISYENALLSFGSSIYLTSREKVSVHWGN